MTSATGNSIALHHLRSATAVFTYGGKRFLIDPLLATKGTYPGFPHSANSHLRNPLVELPLSDAELSTLLESGVDAVLLTHTHLDHWDDVAAKLIPKDKPFYVQNASDADIVKKQGFTNVQIMSEDAAGTVLSKENGKEVTLHKAYCQHGPDALYAIAPLAEQLGSVTGLVFTADNEKTVYFMADTVVNAEVEKTLIARKPDVVVINAGQAMMDGFDTIICGREEVLRVHQLLPSATLVAVHLEAINHCVLSRAELREYSVAKGFSDKLLIPADGETLQL